jgi:uncharacterized OB-fold protein
MSATDHADLSAAYWDGARRGVLVLQQCGNCGTSRHYPRAMCASCYSFDVRHVEHDGRGTVHSWTVAHHAFSPETAGDLPYTLVTVDLGNGVRALGRLAAPAQPALGLPVRLEFTTDSAGEPVPVFHVID